MDIYHLCTPSSRCVILHCCLTLPNICSKGILFPPPRVCVNTLSSISAALPCSLWVRPSSGEGGQQRREAASISLMADLMLLCLKGNLAASSVSVTCQHPSGSDIRMNIIFFLSPRVITGLFKGFSCQNSPGFVT